MFEGQPRGLFALALANTGERFGYYTMLAVFVLFLQENFGWSAGLAGTYYSTFLMFVYFLPFIGGILADKFGYGKMVKIGISVMFLGYVLLAVPLGNGGAAVGAVIGALALISIGTGLFKGNLQVMVGDLYASPEMASKRDSAFSLFYMAINIGALFAPTAAIKIMDYAQKSLGFEKADSYHFAFGVACISLIISILIYFATRSSFRHVEGGHTAVAASDKSKSVATEPELSKEDTKARIVALCLVFAVVIFFWMSFHQNGLTLTYFARDFVATQSTGIEAMLFDVTNLVMVIVAIYASFAVAQSKTSKGRIIATAVTLLCAAGIVYKGLTMGDQTVEVSAPIFQQFNPCFVVGLTPVSIAIFGWLNKRGIEPSAPRKIAYGMLVAAIGFCIILAASLGLLTPNAQKAAIDAGQEVTRVSPQVLVYTYLVLTFAELLLSPMGISFVSKVAPPKYKGMMMGGWFVATAIGNLLTVIPAMLWGAVPLPYVWGVLACLCLLSFIFIFSQMRKLEKVA